MRAFSHRHTAIRHKIFQAAHVTTWTQYQQARSKAHSPLKQHPPACPLQSVHNDACKRNAAALACHSDSSTLKQHPQAAPCSGTNMPTPKRKHATAPYLK